MRVLAAAMLAGGILLDSWVAPFPFAPVPTHLVIPDEVPPGAVLVELPIGVAEDATAMYHSTWHRRPIVNGLSGYDPPGHAIWRAAMREGAVEAITAIGEYSDVAIFVDRAAGNALSTALQTRTRARAITATTTHDVLLLDRGPPAVPPSLAREAQIRNLTSETAPSDLWQMLDRDRRTAWSSGERQRGTEAFEADLGTLTEVAAVGIGLGPYGGDFPRELVIELSEDRTVWSEAWRGSGAGVSVAAALVDPIEVPVSVHFPPFRARYVRVRQVGRSEAAAWAVAGLHVFGPP
jgi:hypothetical protein